jgi:hypothetical protein
MKSERAAPSPRTLKRTDRYTGGYLVFVAIRCTLQYIVLPFVLPFFGLTNTLSVAISAFIDVVALGLILFNIWDLWNTSWRWRYLALGVVMISILAVFLYQDISYFLAL